MSYKPDYPGPDYQASDKHLIELDGSPFTYHPWRGRQFHDGQDFLGPDDFISLDNAAAEIKATGKRVILNIGESCTAGWDTRVTIVNRERVARGEQKILAFFQYPTYSDVLRNRIGDEFIVLNAGIPGHTTIHGVRRNVWLLQELKNRGITPDFVSFYFGNNDCQWERNVQDRHTLRSRLPLFLDKWRVKRVKPDPQHIHTRITSEEFGKHFAKMISDARRFGSKPILIRPEIPLWWKPGFPLLEDRFQKMLDAPAANLVQANVDKAMQLWLAHKDAPWSEEKRRALEEASELDVVVPRLKKAYRAVLENVAEKTGTPMVRFSVPREDDDIRYFVDYCHPFGEANDLIVDAFVEIINNYN